MKILELLIDTLDSLTGVDAVALVEEPAIEADFFAFKADAVEDAIKINLIKVALKETFVDRLPGESKEAYIGRCIPVLKSEGYDADQATAICYDTMKQEKLESIDIDGSKAYSTIEEALKAAEEQGCTGFHEHTVEDKVWYMACETHDETMSDKKFSFAVEGDQQMVVGPLMIPDKLIVRVDENDEPYYVFFSQETVKQIAEKMMKEKYLDSVNVEHNAEDTVDGYMVESWLIEDPEMDKQQVYGFNLPKGTWMGRYKIEDLSVWEKVKEGKIKGFSVEGFFSDKFIQAKAVTK
tara:strand:- start:761 stop:1642 length:882 start_codon:yes stop_codon:yes gene_type:complete